MREKDGQAGLQEIGESGFKTFQSLIRLLGIRLGRRENRRYTEKDLANMLVIMAKNNVSANSARKNGPPGSKIPSGSWLLKKIRNMPMKEMNSACGQMITASARLGCLRRHQRGGKFEQCVVAIDKTKTPHYDKNPDMRYLIKSKREAGTNNFESNMTAKIVLGAKEYTLHSELVTRDGFNCEFVRKTVISCSKYRLGARLYLLDREFYSTDTMRTLKELRKDFIIPAVKNTGIKQAISEYAQGKRDAVSRHAISNGTKSHGFNLVIIPSKKPDAKCIFDRYHVFATSLPCRDPDEAIRYIPEQYRERWGIESGYRSSKSIRPYTSSKNPAVRMFMFTISLILSNIWIWLRREVARQTYDMTLIACLNQMINSFGETSHSRWPPP